MLLVQLKLLRNMTSSNQGKTAASRTPVREVNSTQEVTHAVLLISVCSVSTAILVVTLHILLLLAVLYVSPLGTAHLHASPNNTPSLPSSPAINGFDPFGYIVEGNSDQYNYIHHHQNMVLVLDFWERMVNMQTALRRLVQLGVDCNFTVVEPYVYESRVTPQFSFPDQFHAAKMIPQPASLYFQTKDLFNTKSYITHEFFRNTFHLVNSSRRVSVLQAAVFFLWEDDYKAQHDREVRKDAPFYWCDSEFRKRGFRRKNPNGWALSREVYAQRAVCFDVRLTSFPATFQPFVFQNLFKFVRQGIVPMKQSCSACLAIAFMNYRKHAFSGFVSDVSMMPFFQVSPPLPVGWTARVMAKTIRKRLLRRRKYVAVQLRTGKAFTMLAKHERRMASAGTIFKRHMLFKTWLESCLRSLTKETRRLHHSLGHGSEIYMASDMFNDGWKGGEVRPEEVTKIIDEALLNLRGKLGRVHHFDPEQYRITQDMMGLSGTVDAAVCLEADAYTYASPSTFGSWVHVQRSFTGIDSPSIPVQCAYELDHLKQ